MINIIGSALLGIVLIISIILIIKILYNIYLIMVDSQD